MKTLYIISIILIMYTGWAQADITVKIVPKDNVNQYAIPNLRNRVMNLEKAVVELQQELKLLKNSDMGIVSCVIESFGKTYLSTKNTKLAATADVIKKCTESSSSVHCAEEKVKCEEKK